MKGRDVAGTGGCPGSDGAGWAGSAVHSSRLSHAGMSQHDSYVMAPTVPSNREHGSEAFPLLRESCWWLGGVAGCELLVCSVAMLCVPPV